MAVLFCPKCGELEQLAPRTEYWKGIFHEGLKLTGETKCLKCGHVFRPESPTNDQSATAPTDEALREIPKPTAEEAGYLGSLMPKVLGEFDPDMVIGGPKPTAPLHQLLGIYRDIFNELTAKAQPFLSDGDRVLSYVIPCGPLHRAAGKVHQQMFDGEKRLAAAIERIAAYRAALEEIASGLSVENPYDIANRALKETKP